MPEVHFRQVPGLYFFRKAVGTGHDLINQKPLRFLRGVLRGASLDQELERKSIAEGERSTL